jgi:glycosyltransferase involved in cell wall biosynthesis
MTLPRIAVISTVHDTYDTRIFYKQIESLRRCFQLVYFSPVTGAPDRDWILPLHRSRSKWGRLRTQLSLIRRLPQIKAELLPLGILLRFMGKRVVWDMHEDTYNDIKTKPYLAPAIRTIAAVIYRLIQWFAYRTLNGFILAEDKYADYFPHSPKTCVVHNYPLLDRLAAHSEAAKQPDTIVYIGSISSNRGIYQLLEIVEKLRVHIPTVRLVLIGPFTDHALETNVCELIAQRGLARNIAILGKVKNVDAYPLIARCMVGVALLLPEPNFAKSLPTKMFEYMALGLPVVVSNFPLWAGIVAEHDAGCAVDPRDTTAAAEAIRCILTDSSRYAQLSINARRAASRYSWETESTTLIGFLSRIIES